MNRTTNNKFKTSAIRIMTPEEALERAHNLALPRKVRKYIHWRFLKANLEIARRLGGSTWLVKEECPWDRRRELGIGQHGRILDGLAIDVTYADLQRLLPTWTCSEIGVVMDLFFTEDD